MRYQIFASQIKVWMYFCTVNKEWTHEQALGNNLSLSLWKSRSKLLSGHNDTLPLHGNLNVDNKSSFGDCKSCPHSQWLAATSATP